MIAPHWKAAGCWAPAAACFTAAARAAALADALAAFRGAGLLDEKAAARHEPAGQSADAWDACRAALAAALVVESGQVLQQRIDAMAARASDDGMRLYVPLARSRALLNANQGAAALAPSQVAWPWPTTADTRRAVGGRGWHRLALAMAERVDAGLALLRSHAAAARRRPTTYTASTSSAASVTPSMAGDYADALDLVIRQRGGAGQQLADLGEAIEQVANLSTCLTSGRQVDAIAQHRAVAVWASPKALTAAAIQVHSATCDGRFRRRSTRSTGRCSVRTMELAGWQVTAGHRLAVACLRLGQPR